MTISMFKVGDNIKWKRYPNDPQSWDVIEISETFNDDTFKNRQIVRLASGTNPTWYYADQFDLAPVTEEPTLTSKTIADLRADNQRLRENVAELEEKIQAITSDLQEILDNSL